MYVYVHVFNCFFYYKGVFVVTRAVISESSSNRNQTFGFSVLTCSWLLSAMVAPLLSGLSADPITQYNLTLSGEYHFHGKKCLYLGAHIHVHMNVKV